MTAPTQYLRDLREQQTTRRLEVVKALRENPTLTNIQLATRFNVSRNTIAEDRKVIMEELKKTTLTETELLRGEMVTKLEKLNGELEMHRKDGKLPVSIIHEMLLVHRTVIELLGVRKPVVEKSEVKVTNLNFEVEIVPTGSANQSKPPVIDGEFRNNRALGTGK